MDSGNNRLSEPCQNPSDRHRPLAGLQGLLWANDQLLDRVTGPSNVLDSAEGETLVQWVLAGDGNGAGTGSDRVGWRRKRVMGGKPGGGGRG